MLKLDYLTLLKLSAPWGAKYNFFYGERKNKIINIQWNRGWEYRLEGWNVRRVSRSWATPPAVICALIGHCKMSKLVRKPVGYLRPFRVGTGYNCLWSTWGTLPHGSLFEAGDFESVFLASGTKAFRRYLRCTPSDPNHKWNQMPNRSQCHPQFMQSSLELSTCLKQERYVAELTFGRGEKENHTALQIFHTNWARTPHTCIS